MNNPLAKQLVQFALVGGLGTVTNLVIFFVLVDVFGHPPMLGAVASFAVAVSQNYIFNELWTFNHAGDNKISRHRFAKFVLFSSMSLGLNLLILKLLLMNFEFPYYVIPQLFGILAATLLNFLTSRLITFKDEGA